MIEFEEVGHLPSGQAKLKFTNNKFDDIIFTLGRVSFEDQGEAGLVMSYEYDVVESTKEYVKEELDRTVGDLVMQLLDKGLHENDLIYTGGTDEDRNTNTEQPD